MKGGRALLTTGIVIGVCAFATWVWPTVWTYDKLSGRTVRTNRFTGSVQYLTLDGWQSSAKEPPTKIAQQNVSEATPGDPSANQLEAIEGNLGFTGPGNSSFGGELYNGSSKPISGQVVFHIFILSKEKQKDPWPGNMISSPKRNENDEWARLVRGQLADRRIREWVSWPAQHAVRVSISPAWRFDPDRENFEWHIEPVTHESVYREAKAEVLRVWDDTEFEVVLDGSAYLISYPAGKLPDWPSFIHSIRQALRDKSGQKGAVLEELKRRKVIAEARGEERTKLDISDEANPKRQRKAQQLIENFRKKYGHEYDKLSDGEVARRIYQLLPREYPELKDYKSKP